MRIPPVVTRGLKLGAQSHQVIYPFCVCGHSKLGVTVVCASEGCGLLEVVTFTGRQARAEFVQFSLMEMKLRAFEQRRIFVERLEDIGCWFPQYELRASKYRVAKGGKSAFRLTHKGKAL